MKKRIITLASALCLIVSSYAVTYKQTESICEGSSTPTYPTFTASEGDGYQWKKDGTDIYGATSRTYTPTEAGEYSCVITTEGTDIDTGNLITEGTFDKNCNNYPDRQKVQNSQGDWVEYQMLNKQCSNYPISAFTTIAADANDVKEPYFKHIRSVSGNNSNILVCDGSQSNGVKIWYARDLKLTPGVTYRFSCYVANIDSAYTSHGRSSLPNLEFRIEYDDHWGDGESLAKFTAPEIRNMNDPAKWEFKTTNFTFPSHLTNQTAHIFIWNHNTEAEGNDFAIDDIYFGTVLSTDDTETEEFFKLSIDKEYKATVQDESLCPGNSKQVAVHFTDAANHDTTAPANATYLWQWADENTGAQTATTPTLTVTPNSAPGSTKTYSLTIDYSDICPNITTSMNVTTRTDCGTQVEEEYTYTTCQGSAYELTAQNTGTSYTWDSGEATQNLPIESVPAGTTTYTCTIVDGSTTIVEKHIVTATDCGITHNETICIGESIELTPTTQGDSYTWFLPDGTVQRTQTLTVSLSEARTQTYTCEVTRLANNAGAPSLAQNMLLNGDFEDNTYETSTLPDGSTLIQYHGFTSDYDCIALTQEFPGKSPGQAHKGAYFITDKGKLVSVQYPDPIVPGVDGGNYFMECDGGEANTLAYKAPLTMPLEQGREYQFAYSACSHGYFGQPFADITFTILYNGQEEELLTSQSINHADWRQYGVGIYWTAPENCEQAYIRLNNTCTDPIGNDFALDNIMFQPVFRNSNTVDELLATETFNVTAETCTDEESWTIDLLKGTSTTLVPHTTGNAYKWLDAEGNALLDENDQPITSQGLPIVADGMQKYTCEVDLGNGRFHYEHITVTIYYPTVLSPCENDVVVLTPSQQGNYTWYLLNEDGSKTIINEPIITGNAVRCEYLVANATNYILCTITNGTETRNEQWDITVHANPKFEVEVTGRNITIETNNSFTSLVLDGQQTYTETWINMLNVGEHTLTMTDAYGCSSTRTFEVMPVPLEPMVFFSPNGDGNFDRWLVKGIDFYPEAAIQIFDRYHRLLRTLLGEDCIAGWDGNYNGHPMPMDDYWYVIMVPENNQTISGHFVLKR